MYRLEGLPRDTCQFCSTVDPLCLPDRQGMVGTCSSGSSRMACPLSSLVCPVTAYGTTTWDYHIYTCGFPLVKRHTALTSVKRRETRYAWCCPRASLILHWLSPVLMCTRVLKACRPLRRQACGPYFLSGRGISRIAGDSMCLGFQFPTFVTLGARNCGSPWFPEVGLLCVRLYSRHSAVLSFCL